MIPASVILVKETFKSPIMGRMNKFTLLGSPLQAITTGMVHSSVLVDQLDVHFNSHSFLCPICVSCYWLVSGY
jgi:hypothetical protein